MNDIFTCFYYSYTTTYVYIYSFRRIKPDVNLYNKKRATSDYIYIFNIGAQPNLHYRKNKIFWQSTQNIHWIRLNLTVFFFCDKKFIYLFFINNTSFTKY